MRAGCAALLWVLAPAAVAASLQEDGARLEQIRVELDARRAALRDLDNQQRSLVDSLGQLDETLARLAESAAATTLLLEQQRAEVAALERSVGYDEGRLRQTRARLEQRLRVLVVEGEGAGLRALLGAADFTELALRLRLMKQLARTDARLVDEIGQIEARIAAQRASLRAATEQLEGVLERSARERTLLEGARAERRLALERLASERTLAQRRAHELEEKRAALAALVRTLAESDGRRPLAAPVRRTGVLKDGLRYPVDGLVIRHFGAIKDRDTGAEIVSNGIEFRADEGVPVMASADGRVAHVGWMRGFGRVVILDHGAGHHTISAHLSSTSVNSGDEVVRGQVVGSVGETESPNGPKLYFELRENGIPRDPAPLLRDGG